MSKIGSDTRLVRAAEEELIANNGQIEMLAVAKRAGLAVGNAYHHFGSKAGLIAAVVEKFYAPLVEITLKSPEAGDSDWRIRERQRTAAFVDYHYDHPFAPLMVGRLGREPEVLEIERSHLDRILSEGERNLADAQARGFVSPDLDPSIAIAQVIGGVRQVLVMALSAEQRPNRHVLTDHIWDFIVRALDVRVNSDSQRGKSNHVA